MSGTELNLFRTACEKGILAIVKPYMMRHTETIVVEKYDKLVHDALDISIKNGRSAVVEYILLHHVNNIMHYMNDHHYLESVLQTACKIGKIGNAVIVEQLLNKMGTSKLIGFDAIGFDAIVGACDRGHTEIVCLLIKHMTYDPILTDLMCKSACMRGHVAIVERLLCYPCKDSCVFEGYRTALMYSQVEIVECLLQEPVILFEYIDCDYSFTYYARKQWYKDRRDNFNALHVELVATVSVRTRSKN